MGEAERTDWHGLTAADAVTRLGSGPAGLSQEEAAARLTRYGANRLPEPAGRSALRRFIDQFNNLLIGLLLLAAGIAGVMGHGLDAGVILGVVLVNGIVGFIQEGRAEQALAAIRTMLQPNAAVLRGGHRQNIDAADLVPGDLVLLEAGDRVGADLRLTSSRGLRVDESALTGESVPVEKDTGALPADTGLADRICMAFSGTLVTAGQGWGVVTATGTASELGRISRLIESVGDQRSPLLRRMDEFARRLSWVIIGICALLLPFALLVQKMEPAEGFLLVVGIAVAAIPEGLPAVLTITLAIGVRRMAARNAIIRHLAAVETLGSVDVICSDKTGTLTRNEMIVDGARTGDGVLWSVAGEGYAPVGDITGPAGPAMAADNPALDALARAALLCNDASIQHLDGEWRLAGDPMEGALVAFAMKAGLDPSAEAAQWPRRDAIPFDAGHRFMATLHDNRQDRALLLVKGAPERVLALCGPETDHAAWTRTVEDFAAKGQRVLALAHRDMPYPPPALSFTQVEGGGLTLLGLVGLIDPPRAEATAAIAECHDAGIDVKMITGDHAGTAAAIAVQLGLRRTDRVVTGRDLAGLDAAALRQRVAQSDVFARTTPEDKMRLIAALRDDGRVIAMTGDGVNDAPALKSADVGIAMGKRGTEAAKEAARMVLADDNFASIVAAVREGRTVGDNIRKVIAWTLPTNGAEVLCMMVALILGTALPMSAVQILWVNMVTDMTLGLTLAFEDTEDRAMRRPPAERGGAILTRFLVWRTVLTSLIFLAAVQAALTYVQYRGGSEAEGRTLAVNSIVLLELFYLFSIRWLGVTRWNLPALLGGRALWLGVGTTLALQAAFTWAPPFNHLFGTAPLPLTDLLLPVGFGVGMLLLYEGEKWWRGRR